MWLLAKVAEEEVTVEPDHADLLSLTTGLSAAGTHERRRAIAANAVLSVAGCAATAAAVNRVGLGAMSQVAIARCVPPPRRCSPLCRRAGAALVVVSGLPAPSGVGGVLVQALEHGGAAAEAGRSSSSTRRAAGVAALPELRPSLTRRITERARRRPLPGGRATRRCAPRPRARRSRTGPRPSHRTARPSRHFGGPSSPPVRARARRAASPPAPSTSPASARRRSRRTSDRTSTRACASEIAAFRAAIRSASPA